jgi:hypothetical protein
MYMQMSGCRKLSVVKKLLSCWIEFMFDDISVYSICIWTGSDGKTEAQASSVSAKEVNSAPDKALGATVTPASAAGNLVGTVVSPGMTTALEHRNTPNMNTKTTTNSVPQPCAVLPPETWVQVLSENCGF